MLLTDPSQNEKPTGSGRRYGEPDWKTRPAIPMNLQPVYIGMPPNVPPEYPFPAFTDESYEEWRVRSWTRTKRGMSRNDQAFSAPDSSNYLSILRNSSDMIDVHVGKEKSQWHLHAKLLINNSDFFKAAISSAFKESKERKVDLPDDKDDVFGLFVQWLYSADFTASSLSLLIRAYVLGDKLAANEFRDRALDKIWKMNGERCRFSPEHLLWTFENTMPDAALRKLAMHSVGYGILSKQLNYSAKQWESLESIMAELMQGVVSIARLQGTGFVTNFPRTDYRD